MKYDIFISHASEEISLAESLAQELRTHHLTVWRDKEQLLPGDSLVRGLNNGLALSSFVVALISRSYLAKKWPMMELEASLLAEKDQRKLIPVLVGITRKELADQNPIAASKISINWDGDTGVLAEQITSSISPRKTTSISLASIELSPHLADCRFSYRSLKAPAVPLAGAGRTRFYQEDIVVLQDDDPYEIPESIDKNKENLLNELLLRTKRERQDFFDGPCVRLLEFSSPVRNVVTENRQLILELRPLGWYDYSVVREYTDKLLRERNSTELSKLLNIDEIVSRRTLASSKLTNILDTATTAVTTDGYILYSQRSQSLSSVPSLLTSAVAENMHRNKDGWLDKMVDEQMSLPFRTALRGIGEELSPWLEARVRYFPDTLVRTGLSFDLLGLHPNLLFLVACGTTFSEILEKCRFIRGKDWHEGQIRAVHIDDSSEIRRLLSQENWTGGGVASFLRAIEFLQASALALDIPYSELCRELSSHLESRTEA